ncbi:MAG: hypothetical protein CR986_06640 [Ignavibacteriae bacterium]|nr:MAG: hypothetical protein CR986_06640 [Ignavibacteriota bacterium]
MFLYYIKETFNSLLNSKLGSLLIITTTTIALIFVSFSIGLISFSAKINNKLKENIKINLFVNDSITGDKYSLIEEELKNNIYIESFKFVDKEKALKIMQEKTGKDFASVLEANPLPASYSVRLVPDSVSAQSIEPIIKTLEKVIGIDEVVYDYNLTLKLLNYTNSSKKIIYWLSIFLVFLSIYLVYSNNKLLLSSRITQYNTMKLVGAKLQAIKIPIFLNGIIIGIVAATICLALYLVFLNFVTKFYNITYFEFNETYFYIMLYALGILLGFLGSYFATLNVSLKINKVK